MSHPNDTHLKSIGYILWIFGFTGSHRFYYGKPVTGTIWFFTLAFFASFLQDPGDIERQSHRELCEGYRGERPPFA